MEKIIVCEPGKRAYVKEVEDLNLETMQHLVGGYIEHVYAFEDEALSLWCNEEGKMAGLALNRPLFDEDGDLADVIAGTCFICSATEDGDSVGLTDAQIGDILTEDWVSWPWYFYRTRTGGVGAKPIKI